MDSRDNLRDNLLTTQAGEAEEPTGSEIWRPGFKASHCDSGQDMSYL